MSATQQQPEIHWTVSLERANLILSILAQQPFERVADLIGDLKNQAQSQLQQQMQPSAPAAKPNGSAAPDARLS